MQPPISRAAVKDEPFDASDPKAVARAEAEASLREDQLRQVEAALLATPQGRTWAWWLLTGACSLWDEKINVSGGQYEQGFLNGQQKIGKGLMRRFARANSEMFALMLAENDKS